mgnify:FL=1
MDQSTNMVATWIAENFFWVFLGVFFINLLQKRRQQRAVKKRFATLYLGIGVFGIYVSGLSIVEFGLSDLWLIPAVAIIVGVLYRYREHTFPFTLYCQETGKRLTWNEILYDDSNLSAEARARHEEAEETEQAKETEDTEETRDE